MSDASEVVEPADAADDDDTDDASAALTLDYDPAAHEQDLAASLVGSVTSSVSEHVFEHGRRYHRYKSGRYPIPNDDKEAIRENVRNALFLELLGGRLHVAPIGSAPQNIMDVGTGFGDWAIEMGDRYPSARVVGLDLSPIQSVWIPPNVEFVVDDVEDNAWIHGSDFDLIHFRMVAIVLKDPAAVARTAFAHLRPGGWIEFHELVPRIGCDDGPLPGDYAVARFYRLAGHVLQQQHGWDMLAAEHLPAQLERLGFVRIQREVCPVPLGHWADDRHRMQLAFLFEEALAELMIAMRAKPLNCSLHEIRSPDTGERLTAADIDALCADVRAALHAKDVHAHIPFHIVWAQKPGRADAEQKDRWMPG